MTKEHKTKRRHKQSRASTLTHLVANAPQKKVTEKTIPQRLKDLSETNDEEKNVEVVLLKRKENYKAQTSLSPKKARISKTTLTTKKVAIPSIVPQRVKNKATKVNPKIDDKEWFIPIIGDKQWAPSSLLDNKSTKDAHISPLCKSPPTATKQRPPLSPTHFNKFRSTTKKRLL